MKNLRLMKVLTALSIVAAPLPELHQHALANTASQGTVIADDLNVRAQADMSSKIVGQLHQGDTVEIIDSKNNWDQIKLPNNQTGWVYNAWLAQTQNIGATVEAFVLRVHENPNLESKVVGRLKIGTKITIQAEQTGWAKIVSSSGVEGWVSENYIRKDTPADSAPPSKKEDLSQGSKPLVDPSIQKPAQNGELPLKGKIIVLDAGHGGKDDGATSITGTHEKSLTLPTVQAVEQKLKDAGAIVYMTRNDDTYIPLNQRSGLANQIHADAFISFHYNWSQDSSANGLTSFYYQKSNNPLASDILNEVVKTTGLKNDGAQFDDLYVLRNNSQPSTLIELGFLSNKQDDSTLERPAFRNQVAQGVYQGLLTYFSNK